MLSTAKHPFLIRGRMLRCAQHDMMLTMTHLSVRRDPQHTVGGNGEVEILPALAAVARDQNLARAGGAVGMAPRYLAEARVRRVSLRRMIDDRRDHRRDLVGEALAHAVP